MKLVDKNKSNFLSLHAFKSVDHEGDLPPLPNQMLPPLPKSFIVTETKPSSSLQHKSLSPGISALAPPKSPVISDVQHWFQSLSKAEQKLVISVGHGLQALEPKDRTILFETCLPDEKLILTTCAKLIEAR